MHGPTRRGPSSPDRGRVVEAGGATDDRGVLPDSRRSGQGIFRDLPLLIPWGRKIKKRKKLTAVKVFHSINLCMCSGVPGKVSEVEVGGPFRGPVALSAPGPYKDFTPVPSRREAKGGKTGRRGRTEGRGKERRRGVWDWGGTGGWEYWVLTGTSSGSDGQGRCQESDLPVPDLRTQGSPDSQTDESPL